MQSNILPDASRSSIASASTGKTMIPRTQGSTKVTKLYLSGPMTGLVDLNRSAFKRGAIALRKKGYRVINPPELDRNEPQRSWEGCLRRDITHLMECSMIATLPGWKKSRGAMLEIYIGRSLKYPVHSVGYYLRRRHG